MAQVNGDCGTATGTGPFVCGVWGDCAPRPGVVGTSTRNIGVRGISETRPGVYGRSTNDRGVLGYGRRFGVHGIADGQGSDADPTVYAGVYGQGADFGVYCIGALGLHSETSFGAGGIAGDFAGSVYVTGNLFVTGVKSAAVPHPDGTLRRLCAVESPESWFEDVGRAELREGRADVRLDADFAALVATDDYHVFLTPEGESGGLYVGRRGPEAFEVREGGGGSSSLWFSYRVVARRGDARVERLGKVEPPPHRTAPELEAGDLDPPAS